MKHVDALILLMTVLMFMVGMLVCMSMSFFVDVDTYGSMYVDFVRALDGS